MQLYQKMYLHLFNAVTDALRALENGQTEHARLLLVEAQQQTEAHYVEHGNSSVPQTDAL